MSYYNDEHLYHWGVKGMKWGVRRYQNKDGSLTDAGQKRYDRDKKENEGKKNSKKISTPDPNRWVNEDLRRTKKLAEAGTSLATELKKSNDKAIKKPAKARMDLSNMSDKELRDRINRELLERQYNDVFNPPQVSKGRAYMSKVLEAAGTATAVASSALGIALAIKELRG